MTPKRVCALENYSFFFLIQKHPSLLNYYLTIPPVSCLNHCTFNLMPMQKIAVKEKKQNVIQRSRISDILYLSQGSPYSILVHMLLHFTCSTGTCLVPHNPHRISFSVCSPLFMTSTSSQASAFSKDSDEQESSALK